ncbi:MAG TPA: SpoIIE family protein phosphatase [Thermoguttaceae bacterium]|nr:SpoIIE family protein phosphatase [Thermoguttaceae bacterium]
MTAILRVLKGLDPGQLLPLGQETIVLGRNPDCDIVVDAGAVSRQHARLVHAGGRYYVEDLNSRNGTFVNERRVFGRQPLAENDELRICDLVFVFHEETPTDEEPDGGTVHLDDGSAVMVDGHSLGSSSVMSKLDVAKTHMGLRLDAQPEAKLKALVEIGQNLGKTLSLDEVLPKLLDSLFRIFIRADRGFIVLKDAESGRLRPMAVKHRRAGREDAVRISRTIVKEVMNGKEAILSADAASDVRFDMAESVVDFHIRSMMCAPLVGSDGGAMGVIQVDALDPRNRFSSDDLDVLASVAGQLAAAVENAQLHEAALRQRALEHELAIAHEVQQGFLPERAPELEGYVFFDFYEPANQLGGDWFDYVALPDGRVAVVLADVSGKGISAALLVARLSAEVRYSLASQPGPGAALGRVNKVFCHDRWQDRFITLGLGVLDPGRHEVTLVSAGHMSPVVFGPRGIAEVVSHEATGLPLGVDEATEYRETLVTLEPRETLTLYTDGITEAMNHEDQFYGRERLFAQIAAANHGDVTDLGERILGDVKRFVGARTQSDDMCLVCVGRNG